MYFKYLFVLDEENSGDESYSDDEGIEKDHEDAKGTRTSQTKVLFR